MDERFRGRRGRVPCPRCGEGWGSVGGSDDNPTLSVCGACADAIVDRRGQTFAHPDGRLRTIVRSRALEGNWAEHTTIALNGDGEKEIEYEELDRRGTTNWRRVD